MILRYVLLLTGSLIITAWGIALLFSTKSVVSRFGSISLDNRRILTMAWVAQGLTVCFIGVLVLLVTWFAGPQNLLSVFVYRASAWMLVVMAALTFFTGAKSRVAPIGACPLVKSIVAILFFLGSAL